MLTAELGKNLPLEVSVESKVRVRSLAFLGVLLGATACADSSATAPITKTPSFRRDVSFAHNRPTRFANTVKYRDKGKKNARAVAGAASLEARALLGRDGRTTLDLSTGTIDGPAGPGVLSKVQVKLFAPDGALQTTSKYKDLNTPTYQLTLLGRVRNSGVQVQANIVGITANQTDVATVTETVKLRPDVSVDRIIAPAQSRVKMPVTISALISENNGDVGARSDCVLAVDGVEVDRAHGIWIDAGRSVSCLFNHIFRTTGTKQLTVSTVSVSPGDWDVSNNSAAQTIEIVLPTNQFSWEGTYYATRNWTGTSFSQGYWTRPDVGDRAEWKIDQVIHRYDTWVAHIRGKIGVINGPLTFSLHDEIDGIELDQVDFDPITDIPSYAEGTYEDPEFGTVHYQDGCTLGYRTVPIMYEGREVLTSPAIILVCTFVHTGPSVPADQSFTEFGFTTTAGDVSYYGEHWENYNDGTPDNQSGYTFSFNGDTNYAFGNVVFGKEYKFALSVSGPTVTKTASGTIHLSDPRVLEFSIPYQCQDISDGSFVQHACFSANYTQTVIDGSASGTPE